MGVDFLRCPAVLAFAFACLVSQAYIAQQKIISDTEKLLFDSANLERPASSLLLLTWVDVARAARKLASFANAWGPAQRPFLQRLRNYLPAAGFSAWGKPGALSVLPERMKEAACFQGEKPRGVATSFGFTQHKASSQGA